MIVALAGRRIDERNAKEMRFPLAMEDVVYTRILEFFQKKRNNITTLISSAACGADLLALKAAKKLDIQRHIILPFARARFRVTSVTDRPGDWGKLFDEMCNEAESEGRLIILKAFESEEEAYSAVTTSILDHAESLRSIKKNEKLLAVVVWEGKEKSKNDETKAFEQKAKGRRFKVKTILTMNESSLKT